ncbi:phosphatidylserine decarboxylase family protein [uncultured Fretibacterium sp.]|mgnify:FL=1|uniref:phosphatidylserine decarboxylase family protein n=1 Tax=uncultured Fretibacterium sp. TaxID=1678694 RepID=UPI002615CD85|nr:phosphatidylserine decarboxylase family protein [uncultured Fretibacterium sp.]
MKLARDGIPTITFLVLAAAAFAFISPLPAAVLAVLAALVVWFYRDPDRTAPDRDGLFISPADGRVVEISEAEHPFTGPSVKVGIFMNVFSVHVNRAPCMGRVDYLEYVPGKKIAAFAPKASEVNERNLVGLSTPYGPVLMVQIAGLLARRIVCRLRRGEVLEAGQRYGMIRLGSRVDIYLPKDVRLLAKHGDKVYAGISSLGVMDS